MGCKTHSSFSAVLLLLSTHSDKRKRSMSIKIKKIARLFFFEIGDIPAASSRHCQQTGSSLCLYMQRSYQHLPVAFTQLRPKVTSSSLRSQHQDCDRLQTIELSVWAAIAVRSHVVSDPRKQLLLQLDCHNEIPNYLSQ